MESLKPISFSAPEVDQSEYKRDEGAPGQGGESVGIAESLHKVPGVGRVIPEKAAHIGKAHCAGDDKHRHRQHKVNNPAAGIVGAFPAGGGYACGVILSKLGVQLMQVHGAVVKAHEHKGDDEHNGQKRVEVIRNGPDKELDAVIVLHNAGDRSGPGGDGSDHADGGGGGVNEIGQLRPGDLLILADRAHDGANGQAVKIVVHKDQHAEKESGEHRAHSGFDMLLRPAAKGGGTARPVYQGYHYP